MKGVWASLALLAGLLALGSPAWAQRGAQPGPPPTARAAAVLDLEGYWVSVVSEDWRYRMVTPTKGDYQSVPMTQAALKVADAWDPVADEKAGQQCKYYGAAAIMRLPGRLRVSWQDDQTLKMEADAGTQTRFFKFGAGAARSAERSWQGDSAATWEVPRGARGRGAATASPIRNGSLKVVTTNLRSGYLRKNGVPYSDDATVTEYFSIARLRGGQEVLVVTAVVDDPQYLTQPFIVSSQFKRQADAAGWEPTPCASQW